MKTFIKENWFRLMTGTSMLVFSFAFLLYVVSPTYASQTSENKTPEEVQTNDDIFIVESGGYLYSWGSKNSAWTWVRYADGTTPRKKKLP